MALIESIKEAETSEVFLVSIVHNAVSGIRIETCETNKKLPSLQIRRPMTPVFFESNEEYALP